MKTLPYLFKKPLRTFSLFLFFLPLLVSCNKESLTKPTQTGANTFSCKINGKVYVAKNDLFAPGLIGGLRGGGATNSYHFECEAVMYIGNKSDYTIDLTVSPPISEGAFNITYGKLISNTGNGFRYSANGGSINFNHIDYLSQIISGTFSFTAVNSENSADVIAVTDGRFDMKN
ncbi:hypothetical protein [Mucilaginibacter sp.]|uniref:hypothetical protein n=1 Tax=Mucilaginibacter sp. TaxID=1882438 RepID=UPI003B0040E6